MAEPLADVTARPRFDALAPLRHRPYARLWTGAFVSNIGTWMETLALGLYVQKVTHQAAWTGTIAAAAFVPIAFFGPIGGALADRFPRKWLLMITTFVQTGLATLLAVLFAAGHPSPIVLTVIAFGNGICAGLGFPAFQAILPDLVPVEDLPGAIALSSAQYNLGRVVGPALAGIVIGLGGYAAAEAVNAASFFAVIAVLVTLPLPPPSAQARDEGFFRSIVDGFRFVRREPGLRVNAAAMCLNTFLAAPFIALVPAMAVGVLHRGTAGTTILITLQGAGAVTMALLLGNLITRHGPRRLLVFLMATLTVALAAYAYAPNLALSAVAILVVGALYLGALSTFSSIAQLRAPASIRGRVVSVNTMILGSLYPLGAVLQGKIADGVGLRATTFGAAAIMAAVLVGARLIRPGITGALDTAVDQGRPMAVVELERREHIALITLNRPEARNAVSPEVSQTMATLLDEVEADAALRAVVLTGAGDVFSAGADLKVVAAGNANDIARGKGGFAGIVTRDFPKPIIAAVNGPALAGGFEIVLSCDLVVAADTARFGIPEVKRGLMAAAGGLIRLPKRVPLAVALELAMTGDPIDADRALQLGLVNRVAPAGRVVAEAIALAERIGENSPIAVRNSRQLVREAAELSEADGWKRTLELMMPVFESGDAVEGATAFAEKRPPVWRST